jgi:hypothetical protein
MPIFISMALEKVVIFLYLSLEFGLGKWGHEPSGC